MDNSSVVALLSFIEDGLAPEFYCIIDSISEEDKQFELQFDKKHWVGNNKGSSEKHIFTDKLEIVKFLFENNYRLSQLRENLESSISMESCYLVMRYKKARELIGKEKITADLEALNGIKRELDRTLKNIRSVRDSLTKVKDNLEKTPKLYLVKNESE